MEWCQIHHLSLYLFLIFYLMGCLPQVLNCLVSKATRHTLHSLSLKGLCSCQPRKGPSVFGGFKFASVLKTKESSWVLLILEATSRSFSASYFCLPFCVFVSISLYQCQYDVAHPILGKKGIFLALRIGSNRSLLILFDRDPSVQRSC